MVNRKSGTFQLNHPFSFDQRKSILCTLQISKCLAHKLKLSNVEALTKFALSISSIQAYVNAKSHVDSLIMISEPLRHVIASEYLVNLCVQIFNVKFSPFKS